MRLTIVGAATRSRRLASRPARLPDALSAEVEVKMRIARILVSLMLSSVCLFAQEDTPTFKTQATSAFVWGQDINSGAISSRVTDPLTGTETLKLRYAGVEVSSRMGFEKLQREQSWEYIAYSTTIVNNTDGAVSVKYGAITVDGRIVSPLAASTKSKQNTANSFETARLYCFSSGFLSHENFFALKEQTPGLTVQPRRSLTVSSVVRDPRHYSILCSTNGCLPKGMIRYSIQVGGHDYVFIWPGRSLFNCGR